MCAIYSHESNDSLCYNDNFHAFIFVFQKAAASAKWHQAEVARLRNEREQRLSGDFEVMIQHSC